PGAARGRARARGRHRVAPHGPSAAASHGGGGDPLGERLHVGALLRGEPDRDRARGKGPGSGRGMNPKARPGTFQRLKIPLLVVKILLSVLLFAYVIAK